MTRLIVTSLILALTVAGCATTDPVSTQRTVTPAPPTGTAGEKEVFTGLVDTPTESPEAVIFRGNDRVVNMPDARPAINMAGDAVTLNFEQAPITEVVHSILGDILELDYVIGHPLSGEVTLRTRSPVPRDQLLPILESLLQSNGARMVRDADDRYFVSASADLTTLVPGFGSAGTAGAGYTNVIVDRKSVV